MKSGLRLFTNSLLWIIVIHYTKFMLWFDVLAMFCDTVSDCMNYIAHQGVWNELWL